MTINTDFLDRCIETLEAAFEQLQQHERGDILYDVLRAVCVKEFELAVEQSGQLLRKRLRPWFASNRQGDRLTFKSIFRHAAKHGLMSTESCERTCTARLLPRPRAICCRRSSPTRWSWQQRSRSATMTDRLHLRQRYRKQVEALLCEHAPGIEVWAYGSRVAGGVCEGGDHTAWFTAVVLAYLGDCRVLPCDEVP